MFKNNKKNILLLFASLSCVSVISAEDKNFSSQPAVSVVVEGAKEVPLTTVNKAKVTKEEIITQKEVLAKKKEELKVKENQLKVPQKECLDLREEIASLEAVIKVNEKQLNETPQDGFFSKMKTGCAAMKNKIAVSSFGKSVKKYPYVFGFTTFAVVAGIFGAIAYYSEAQKNEVIDNSPEETTEFE